MFTTSPSLSKSISVLFFLFLIVCGLYFAREFLIPIAISALLAMLLIPLCTWFERKGINRVISSILCILFLLSCVSFIVSLLSWQASGISDDLSQISSRLGKILDNIRQYIAQNLGISTYKQKKWLESQSSSGSAGAMGMAGTVLSSLMGVVVNTVLILVYIFLFIYSRSHLKRFVLMLVPETANKETEKVIGDGSKVAQKYISGMGTMIVILWIMYSIGFSIVGVKSAIFFAILCGLLEIVPFIGNLTGTSLTVLMVISQGGNNGMIIGVLITYLLVQFIQTYILEPLVVGSEVNINPLFTILVLVLMEIIWGIPGMILAIPMLGIVKIICDHVRPLKPYGFLIGKERSDKQSPMAVRLKEWLAHKK